MSDMHIRLWPDWKIVREIGRGSFGKVYEIHRKNGSYLERAALKVIRVPESAAEMEQLRMDGLGEEGTEDYLKRYVEEIRNEIGLMQQFVGYSNIVSYEDYLIQKHENEVGWDILIRMELLTPLPDYMASHPMSEKDVIQLGLDISQALVICHGAGIIHRDIKPQNIFVNPRRLFKLGDFGISRSMPGSGSVLSFKGSVPYMAPETFAMRNTDARSDIYSLALVLYRILNGGREPFLSSSKFTPAERENAQRRRLTGEVLPVPLSGSSALCSVLAVALSPDPAARYQTAAEFRAALQRAAGVDSGALYHQLQGGNAAAPYQQLNGRSAGISGQNMPDQQTGGYGKTTLNLHAVRQQASVDFDRSGADGRTAGFQSSGQARNRSEMHPFAGTETYTGSGYYGGREPGEIGRGRFYERDTNRKLLIGILCGMLVLLLGSLSVIVVSSVRKSSNGAAGSSSVSDTSVSDTLVQGNGTGGGGEQETGAQSGAVSDQEKQTDTGQGTVSQELTAQSDTVQGGSGFPEMETGYENSDGDQDTGDSSENGDDTASVGFFSGDSDGSFYTYTESVEYVIVCEDAYGNSLRDPVTRNGLRGHVIILDAPEITGYEPREDSQSISLSGNEEENVVTFVYDEKGYIPSQAKHYNGHSYFACVSSGIDSYWEAVNYCENLGGYIAVINTAEENRVLYDYVFDELGYLSAYFGYTDDGSEGSWYWAGNDSSSYENWAGGQPDNLRHGDKTENYALFYYTDSRYKWNDGDFGPDSSGNVIFLIEWDW